MLSRSINSISRLNSLTLIKSTRQIKSLAINQSNNNHNNNNNNNNNNIQESTFEINNYSDLVNYFMHEDPKMIRYINAMIRMKKEVHADKSLINKPTFYASYMRPFDDLDTDFGSRLVDFKNKKKKEGINIPTNIEHNLNLFKECIIDDFYNIYIKNENEKKE
jgi:hypothetical protein